MSEVTRAIGLDEVTRAIVLEQHRSPQPSVSGRLAADGAKEA